MFEVCKNVGVLCDACSYICVCVQVHQRSGCSKLIASRQKINQDVKDFLAKQTNTQNEQTNKKKEEEEDEKKKKKKNNL